MGIKDLFRRIIPGSTQRTKISDDAWHQAVIRYCGFDDHSALEVIKETLENGFNPNVPHPETGDTALCYAASDNKVELATVLIRHGADVNSKNEALDFTVLETALHHEAFDVAQLLIEKGAVIKNDGCIKKVAGAGHQTLLAILLEKGIPANTETYGVGFKETPLHSAALNGKTKAIALLLDYGADIDAQGGIDQETPLMWAAKFGQLEAVKVLLNRGAATDILNKEGKNVRQLVQKRLENTDPKTPALEEIAQLIAGQGDPKPAPDGHLFKACLDDPMIQDVQHETRRHNDLPNARETAFEIQDNQFDKADDQIESWIKDSPDFWYPYFWKAELCYRRDGYARAKDVVEQGLRCARTKYELCAKMAQIEWAEDRIDQAVVWWSKSIASYIEMERKSWIDPKHPGDDHSFLYLAYVAQALNLDPLSDRLLCYVDQINSAYHTDKVRLSEEMQTEIRQKAASIRDPEITKLLETLLSDYLT